MQKQGKKSKLEKLQLIQSVLNGNFDFEQFATPERYEVIKFDNPLSYTVTCQSDPNWSKLMNEDEYQAWHSKLKDCDVVILLVSFEEHRTNDPLMDESQIQAIYEADRARRIETPAKEVKPVKSKQNKPEEQTPAIRIEQDIFPIMPNYGSISDYGMTWKLRKN